VERRWESGVDLHQLWSPARSQERRAKGSPSRPPQAYEKGVMRCAGTPVTLLRSGTIRTHKTADALASPRVGARILSATVPCSAQRGFGSFAVEVERALPDPPPRPGRAIDIEVGLKALVTAVDHRGQVIRIAGRGRCGLRGNAGCAARAHSCFCVRTPTFGAPPRSQLRGEPSASMSPRQATSLLASWYETVVEGLNMTGMVRNRRVARSLAEWALGRVRQRLGSKTTWRGGRPIVADPFFPQLQDLLDLWDGECRAVPGRAPGEGCGWSSTERWGP
jgi:putative transposase